MMKKREFIKTSAVLAGTALLPSSMFAFSKGRLQDEKNNRIRITVENLIQTFIIHFLFYFL